MVLVDGPDTVSSESPNPTGTEGDHGETITQIPDEDQQELLEQVQADQDQGVQQEDHVDLLNVELQIGPTEGSPGEVTFTSNDPNLDRTDERSTGSAMGSHQAIPDLERFMNDVEEKLEEVMRSVQRIPREDMPALPEEAWSTSSQRQLKFEEPKQKVVFFEPETISRGPTRRDSQAWNDVITGASKQAEVYKSPGRQDLASFSTRNKVTHQRQVMIDGDEVTLLPIAKSHGGLGVRLYSKRK